MSDPTLGSLIYDFLVDYLQVQRGLRPASIRSYRDALRLFLAFMAADLGCGISRLAIGDLSFDRARRFLEHLEVERGNRIRTRNHRKAMLVGFYEYVAGRLPEMLREAERVRAIPTKRTPPPETHHLSREGVEALLAHAGATGRYAERDRAVLLFLYNTGARAQEVADVRVGDLELGDHPIVRLHGKGGKWRACPLWSATASDLRALLRGPPERCEPEHPVFVSQRGNALTRQGIYKIVRRHAEAVEDRDNAGERVRVSPHVLRHTTAMHLLAAGVDVNVIRGWLGHVSVQTTNRYAEISIEAKAAALRACTPPSTASEAFPSTPVWRNDETLLSWLDSL